MAVEINPEALAQLCFRRVPADVVARDVVLAALWHQHLTGVLLGFSADTPIRHTRLGKAAGMRAHDATPSPN